MTSALWPGCLAQQLGVGDERTDGEVIGGELGLPSLFWALGPRSLCSHFPLSIPRAASCPSAWAPLPHPTADTEPRGFAPRRMTDEESQATRWGSCLKSPTGEERPWGPRAAPWWQAVAAGCLSFSGGAGEAAAGTGFQCPPG